MTIRSNTPIKTFQAYAEKQNFSEYPATGKDIIKSKRRFILMKKATIFFALLMAAGIGFTSSEAARVWTKKSLIASAKRAVPQISVQQAKRLLDSGKAQFIDVRGIMLTKDGKKYFNEIQKTGKIKGAINIPRGLLEFRTKLLNKRQQYVVYCLSGGRAALAAKTLKSMGFKVKNMTGGIKGWKKAGYKLVK